VIAYVRLTPLATGSCDLLCVRSLFLVILFASVVVDAAPSKLTRDSRGWCAKPTASRVKPNKFFEVSHDLRRVAPMRKSGITSFESAFTREDGPLRNGAGLDATIVGNTLTLSTYPRSCHNTGAGCLPGLEWYNEGEVKVTETVDAGACIAYSVRLGRGMAVGIGSEIRTYLFGDKGTVAGPRMKTELLELIDGLLDGNALLQGASGLWLARWDDGKAPTVERLPGVEGRVRSMSTRPNGWYYVFTDRAMYAVDEKTFAPLWKIDGEVWAATSQDVPFRHYVLTIERDATPRAVLRLLDQRGKQLRQIVVYEGDDLIGAQLERTSFAKGDRQEPLNLVYIATR
jgi:hypothetical protein